MATGTLLYRESHVITMCVSCVAGLPGGALANTWAGGDYVMYAGFGGGLPDHGADSSLDGLGELGAARRSVSLRSELTHSGARV